MNFRRIDNKNMYVATIGNTSILKSYDKIIAIKKDDITYINYEFYNYSQTTSKHLNLFLDVNAKKFKENCKNGLYDFISDKEIQEMYYSYIS